MSKSIPKEFKSQSNKNKHLTLDDRIIIESSLNAGLTFHAIALKIEKNPSTISKEVKRNRIKKLPSSFNGGNNICVHRTRCNKGQLCGKRIFCNRPCSQCHSLNCNNICQDFKPAYCTKTIRAPYVCNSCDEKKYCRHKIMYNYYAQHAHTRYRSLLQDCRQGINLTEDELAELDSFISPLLKKGQSLNHVFANHKHSIPCSKKTLYDYIDQGLLSVDNLDLPRKVRYKKRKRKRKECASNPRYRVGRTYRDFLDYIAQNPDIPVVEMDTVEGVKIDGKVLLTFLFRSCGLMLIFLLESQTQNQVLTIFKRLESLLRLETFKKMFPIILTDNGSEFKNPDALELSRDGEKRTRIFYCEPNASWQKARIEKNHEFIRYVLPKPSSFEGLTAEQVSLLRDHINSFSRDSLNGKSPMDLAELLLPTTAIPLLDLRRIPADNIILTPSLFK